MDTQDKPLSLRQRIKQLEQASNSTHLSASSPLASNPVQPQASLAALYRDPTATRVTTRSRADSLKGQLATAGTTNAVINVEPPISPTLTSIRTARAPSYTQNGAHASLAAQLSPAGGNRSRAGSTASIEGGKPTRPTFTTPSPASSRSPAPTPPPSLRRTASPAPSGHSAHRCVAAPSCASSGVSDPNPSSSSIRFLACPCFSRCFFFPFSGSSASAASDPDSPFSSSRGALFGTICQSAYSALETFSARSARFAISVFSSRA
ncbi:hypothetical protein JCM11641_000301 [Rhodosporidiobolus odoratus]